MVSFDQFSSNLQVATHHQCTDESEKIREYDDGKDKDEEAEAEDEDDEAK